MKQKCLKFIELKGKNKRICIYLIENKDGVRSFSVHTKTLIDFKSRNILLTDTVYSVETFCAMANAFTYFIENSEVKNKILLKEISEITLFNGNSNLK